VDAIPNSKPVASRLKPAAPTSPITAPATPSFSTFGQYIGNDVARFRTDRDTDADLVCPLAHKIRDDAVNTDAGQHESHHGKYSKYDEEESSRRERNGDCIHHRLFTGDSASTVDCSQFFSKRLHQYRPREIRTHNTRCQFSSQRQYVAWKLCYRGVELDRILAVSSLSKPVCFT
jgi:hypothetical protein